MNTILVLAPETPLVAGKIAVRECYGNGVRGDALPAGSVDGLHPSYLYLCADLPADNAVEFRGVMLGYTIPEPFFEWYDDGSFRVLSGCPQGAYTFTFQLYADGVAVGSPVTNGVVIGSAGSIQVGATFGDFVSQIKWNGTFQVAATFAPFVSGMVFLGDSTTTVPLFPSVARQYTVNPDVHLDAYAIERQYVLSWEKDPQAVLDYSIKWTDWLADLPGDFIQSMIVSNSSTGVTVRAFGIVLGDVTCVVVAGGVVGDEEEVTVRITTAQARVDERTIRLLIRDR